MPAGALEVGGVVAHLGARLDDTAFDAFDRRLDRARRDTRDPVEAHGRLDLDEAGFRRYDDRLEKARRDTRAPVEANLGAEVKDAAFRKYDDHLDRARRDAGRDVVADLRADAQETGFRRFTSLLTRARRDAAKDVEVDLKADGTQAASGFALFRNRAKGAADTGVEQSRRMGGAFRVMGGTVAAVMGGMAGSAMLTFASESIDAFSDVNESMSKNRVLFGDHARQVEDFAQTSARTFGISRLAALEYAGVFGNLARAMGMSEEKSASLSLELVELAADMASFGNTSIEDALGALQSGLVGESEPLRRYGVTLSATAIAAEAMRSGVVKVTKSSLEYRAAVLAVEKAEKARNDAVRKGGKDSLDAREAQVVLEKSQKELTKAAAGGKVALTDQQKAQAIVNLTMRQTKAAQGDAIRTGDQYAGQVKRQQAALADARVELGEKLLPIQLKVTQAVGKFVGQMLSGEGAGGAFAKTLKFIGRGLSDFADWIRESISTVRHWGDVIMGVTSTVLRGFAAFAEGASRIPIIGKKFRGLADDLNETADSIDRTREAWRELTPEEKKANKAVDDHSTKVHQLRERLKTLTRGSAEYRDTARDLRREQGLLNKSMDAAEKAGRRAGRGISTIKDGAESASLAVENAAATIAANVDRLAKGLGAQGIKFTPAKTQRGREKQSNVFGDLPDFSDLGGAVPRKAGGGWVGQRGQRGADNRMVLGPNGPEALVGDGELLVFNAAQQDALELAVAGTYGTDLRGFFDGAAWPKHYSGGGTPGGFAGGGIVPVPGFPGERAASSILDEIAYVTRTFGVALTDAFGPGHKSAGHTVHGTSADFAGSPAATDRVAAWAVSKGFRVLYDGRFGTIAYPNHGPGHHVHVEFGGRSGSQGPAVAPKLPGIAINGPAGALRRVAQGATDKLTRAGNAFLSRAAGRLGGGSGAATSGGGGRYSKAQLADLWVSQGGDPAMAGLMARIALAESGGDPNIVNRIGAGGLWQIHPPEPNYLNPATNARIAIRKLKTQGLRAWEAYTNGSYQRFGRGGLIPRFAGGKGPKSGRRGKVKPFRGSNANGLTGQGSENFSTVGSTLGDFMRGSRPLRRMQHDRVQAYDTALEAASRGIQAYTLREREYSRLDDEAELINEDGTVNEAQVEARASRLDELAKLREKIRAAYAEAGRVARRVAATYRTLIARLENSLRWARGKNRGAIRGQIATYRGLADEWDDNAVTAEDNRDLSRQDYLDLAAEAKEVRGTKAQPRDPETAAPDLGPDPRDDFSSSDTGDDGRGFETRPPTAEELAAGVAQAFANFNAARSDLFAQAGANFMRAPDLARAATGGATSLELAAGLRHYGAGTPGAQGGVLAGGGVEQHNHFYGPQPPDPHTFTQASFHELKALV